MWELQQSGAWYSYILVTCGMGMGPCDSKFGLFCSLMALGRVKRRTAARHVVIMLAAAGLCSRVFFDWSLLLINTNCQSHYQWMVIWLLISTITVTNHYQLLVINCKPFLCAIVSHSCQSLASPLCYIAVGSTPADCCYMIGMVVPKPWGVSHHIPQKIKSIHLDKENTTWIHRIHLTNYQLNQIK